MNVIVRYFTTKKLHAHSMTCIKMLIVDWRDGPAVKTKDLDLVPNTHMVAQSHL